MFPNDNEDESVHFSKNRFNYIGRDLRKIPVVFAKMYASETKILDLSYNRIISLEGLEEFPALTDLILDNNELGDNVKFCRMPSLQALSLNNNNFIELEHIVMEIRRNFENLTFLSLLGNKACPNQLSDSEKDEDDYQRYRYYLLYHLRNLKFLDCTPVTNRERLRAYNVGQHMHIKKPKEEVSQDVSYDRRETKTFSPLPPSKINFNDHRGAYGKCKFRYTGNQSEGNRFIKNDDL